MVAPQTEVIVSSAGQELARYVVGLGEYIIGHDASCQICVRHDTVSACHAKLMVNADGWQVEDLRSVTGTFVAGQLVSRRVSVAPRQSVQLGAVQLELRYCDAEGAATVAATVAAVETRAESVTRTPEEKYAQGEEVARGGMGAILRVQDVAIRRAVAMKVMLEHHSRTDVLRFMEEAQVTGQLEHPNIIPVHDLGRDDKGQPYYTMKFVKGVTLGDVLQALAQGQPETLSKYSLGSLLTIFQKVCDALAFAHAKGVIHRDLKPANIMLGGYGEVLVMDWGLAKVLGGKDQAQDPPQTVISSARQDAGDTSRTMTGTVMGTPHYMAPEQARGEIEKLDARTDIFSLGAILYHLLTLQLPFTGRNLTEILQMVERSEIQPVPAKRLPHLPGGRVPASLAAVVMKAMARDPAARYSSVTDLQNDIAAFQNGFATAAEEASVWKQFTLFVRRNLAVSLAVVASAVVLLAVASAFLVRMTQERNRTRAALFELRNTAPTFRSVAQARLETGKLEDALEKIGYAIELDATNAEYHLFRANLLQALQRLKEAVASYQRVLALRPGDAAARNNLTLCQRLLAENGTVGVLRKELQRQLLDALIAQDRLLESGPLNAIFEPEIARAEADLKERLVVYCKQVGGSGYGPHGTNLCSRLLDGTFRLVLTDLKLGDLSIFKGLPISTLEIKGPEMLGNDGSDSSLKGLAGWPLKKLIITGWSELYDLSPLRGLPLESLTVSMLMVKDLSPLSGMKLRNLDLGFTRVDDLAPLSGMPLEELDIQFTDVADLSPLRGVPLRKLNVRNTRIKDLSPLAGTPLEELTVNSTAVTNLAPLASCPTLKVLVLNYTPVADLTPLAKLKLNVLACSWSRVTDLEPIRGQPLHTIYLVNSHIADLAPLADCTALADIALPGMLRNLDLLRKLPHLKRINFGGFDGAAAVFWRDYDAHLITGRETINVQKTQQALTTLLLEWVIVLGQGNLPSALLSEWTTIGIAMELLGADPMNRQTPVTMGGQMSVEIRWNIIADLLRKQGDLPGAVQAYRECLAIAKRLAVLDPYNLPWQRGPVSMACAVGEILQKQGDLPGAYGAYSDALAIAKRLVAKYPAELGLQFDLRSCYEGLGQVLQSRGDLAGASSFYKREIFILSCMAAADSESMDFQQDLCNAFKHMAEISESTQNGMAIMWWRKAYEQIDTLRKRRNLQPAEQLELDQLRRKIGL